MHLRFQCTGCGYCCTGDPRRYYVEASPSEQRRIQRHLGISWAWFRRRYVRRVAGGLEGLSMGGGRCAFLGADMRCRIYRVRPAQCRHYPFWPELVHDPAAWTDEARRCEGIDRGAIVPLTRVRALLKKQRA